jgi:PST family polysaccharide transporter
MSLAVMLGQLGIGPALVQARHLHRDDVATAFALSSGLGVVLAGLLFLLAPALDRVVGLPAGSPFLPMLSVVLVLGGLSTVSLGLMQRNLRFRQLVQVEVLSYGVGYLGTSIGLAIAGFGATALIWGQIVQALLLAVGGYATVRHPIRPPRHRVVH